MSVADLEYEVYCNIVTARWVARFYNVPVWRVYRAIRSGRLKGIKVDGGAVVLDKRSLPTVFPGGLG